MNKLGLLVNSALIDAFFDDNLKRTIDDWIPWLKHAGIRYIATVESANDVGKMSNEEFQFFLIQSYQAD